MSRIRSFQMSVLGFVLTLASGAASPQQLYRISYLGKLGGTSTTAAAINTAGQVTGWSYTNGDSGPHAFLWDGTTMQDLGTLGGTYSFALAINASGQVTGRSQTGSGNDHAFLWDGDSIRDLGTLGGIHSTGQAINALGQVTGLSYTTGNSSQHAFIWDQNVMKDLGTLGGVNSSGIAINASGQVTGLSHTTDNLTSSQHAFLWDNNVMNDLGTLGGTFSNGRAINASGQVTGYASPSQGKSHAFLSDGTGMQDLGALNGTYSQGNAINRSGQVTGLLGFPPEENNPEPTHPFLWDGTKMIDIGPLENCGTPYGEGLGINAAGQVIGYTTDKSCQQIAFLWDGGPMRDLNALIDPADPLKRHVRLNRGVDINGRGQIAANGCDSRTNECHAYLTTPLEYQILFIAPATGSQWKLGTTVHTKVALVDVKGKRISDAKAAALVASPCKIKFSASGAQSRAVVCMKYDATANEFYFNWYLGSSGTGSATLKIASTYKFSMPETITTTKSRTISIIQ